MARWEWCLALFVLSFIPVFQVSQAQTGSGLSVRVGSGFSLPLFVTAPAGIPTASLWSNNTPVGFGSWAWTGRRLPTNQVITGALDAAQRYYRVRSP